jgi:hypothetical protein
MVKLLLKILTGKIESHPNCELAGKNYFPNKYLNAKRPKLPV